MQLIAQKQLERIHSLLQHTVPANDSFLSGTLGLAFYYYHLYKASEERKFGDKSQELIEAVFDRLNSEHPGLTGSALSIGGAGLGYVINYLSKENFLSFDIANEFSDLDQYLFSDALSKIDDDRIDYLHGALGTVLYFSERPSHPSIQYYLDILIEKLCQKAVKEESGCWFRNYIFKPEERDNINFSLSHGLSGVLLILIKAYPVTKHKEQVAEIIKEGVQFILKHKIDVDYAEKTYSFFPFVFKKGSIELVAPNRLAWCYGDLNEVLLFYRAGKLLEDENLIRLADLIGAQSLLRKGEEMTMVTDTQFCHGASGLARFYQTLFKESSLLIYRDGYEYWIEQTILMIDDELTKGTYAGKEYGFLEGLTGIAFTLLSFASNKDLKWSQALLL